MSKREKTKPLKEFRMHIYTHKIGELILVIFADKYEACKPIAIYNNKYNERNDPTLIDIFSTEEGMNVVIDEGGFYFNNKLIYIEYLKPFYNEVINIDYNTYGLSY